MGKSEAIKENWTGQVFANNWLIQDKLSCAEYRKIYIEQTGDTSKQIKNTHYLCYNQDCGVSTYIERTVIQRALNSNTSCLTKCKGCNNGDKKGKCHYSIQCREKNLTKTPDRTSKVEIGTIYGVWKVKQIISSGNFSDHQMRVVCDCTLCGVEKTLRLDHLLAHDAACECFKQHSCGESFIKKTLDEMNITYQTEYTFKGLSGIGGGNLRYDFAIFDQNNNLQCLIEYDGEQHFQEPGAYFNSDGKVQIHDNIKNQFALDNNIPLLRIPYYELLQVEGIVAGFLLDILT